MQSSQEKLIPGPDSHGKMQQGFVCRSILCVVDLVLIVLFIALLPILLCILGIVCLFPILDRLLHPSRAYLDGVAAAQIHNAEGAVIHGIVISTERVEAAKVFKSFDKTYISSGRPEFTRFKERIVRPCCLWPYWTDASSNFDPNHHFRCFPEPITKEGLEKELAQMTSELLDFERPVWELRHYENFTDENGKQCSATLFRVHHSMCDGFTLMRFVMQGSQPNKPPNEPSSQLGAERRPRLSCWKILLFGWISFKKLLFMSPDPSSAFKASKRIGALEPKAFAWNSLPHVSVDALKVVGKKLGGATINDMLVSALSAALRKYAQQKRAQVPDEITTCIWVSLSPLKHIYTDFSELPFKWGNSSLGACYLKLAVGEAHHSRWPLDNLKNVQLATGDPALMVEAGMATTLLSLMGWLPGPLSRLMWNETTNKISISMSNIPGPQFPMVWVGLPIRSALFFVPPVGTVSEMVTISTFNGEVSVGMAADAAVLKSEALRQITGELFQEEIRKLRAIHWL